MQDCPGRNLGNFTPATGFVIREQAREGEARFPMQLAANKVSLVICAYEEQSASLPSLFQ